MEHTVETFLHLVSHYITSNNANDTTRHSVNRYIVVLSEQIIPCNFVVLQSLFELRSGSSTRAAYQASLERVLYLRCTVNTCLKHARPRYHRTRSSEKVFLSTSSNNQASCVSFSIHCRDRIAPL